MAFNRNGLRLGQNPSQQDLDNLSFDPLFLTRVGQIVGSPDGTNLYQAQVDSTGALKVTSTGGSGGGLTDAQLRATPVPVSGTVSTTITNDGTFAKETGGNLATIAGKDFATQTTLALIKAKTDNLDVALSTRAVTGLTDTQLRATPVPVSGTVSTGGLTDTQLRASAVPVSLATNTPTLQSGSTTAVTQATGTNLHTVVDSGTVTVSNPTANPETGLAKDATFAKDADGGIKTHVQNFPATQPVSGPLTDTQLRATPVPVSSTPATDITQTGTIAGTTSVTLTGLNGVSDTNIQLSGTFVGTVVFESSIDGTNWNSRVYRGTGVLNLLDTTTSTFPSEWRGNSAAMTSVRVRCTAYTSGTLTVAIRSSTGAGPVFLNAPIPIGAESKGNNSTANISSGASFTGVYEDMTNVASILIDISMNKTGTLHVQWSQDGTTLFSETTFPISGTATPTFLTTAPKSQYFRVVVDNTAGTSTSQCHIEVMYKATATDLFRSPLGNSSLLTDLVLAPPMRAVLTGRSAADTYNDQIVDTNGTAKVKDDYQGGQVLADQTGANAVLTFTFSQQVNQVWINADGGASSTAVCRVDPFGGTPTSVLGIPVYNQAATPILVNATTVKIYTPSGQVVSVWGYYRS